MTNLQAGPGMVQGINQGMNQGMNQGGQNQNQGGFNQGIRKCIYDTYYKNINLGMIQSGWIQPGYAKMHRIGYEYY
jgi:hypothetical protein